MNGETVEQKEMSVIQKIIGVFSSPTETFTSIDNKPTWIVPFILLVLVVLVTQYLLLDISIADRMAVMESRDMSVEQLEAAQAQTGGPLKYIGLIFIPIVMPIIWLITAGAFLFAGNVIMGGKAKFKNIYAMVVWSSLIGIVQAALNTFLVLSKGTTHGVSTSLAVLLPAQAVGAKATLMHSILSKFELFTVWQLILWILGASVVYKLTVKKSTTMIISIWIIYVIIAVALGQLLGGMF